MAEAFNVNPNTAYLAGILHDCAKYYSDSQLLKCCKDNNILVTDYEEKAPYLLHGKVGAFIAKTKYGIDVYKRQHLYIIWKAFKEIYL